MLTISMRRTCPPIAVTLLVLGLAACGSAVSTSGFKGEAHAVAQRISDYQSDIAAASERKLCDEDLSSEVRARLSTASGGCEQALKRQIGTIDDYELTVEKVAVRGATATAIVKSTWSGKSSLSTLELVKQGGSWRIAGLSLE